LLGWPLIDDGDALGPARLALQLPLLLEHAEHCIVEVLGFDLPERGIDLGATDTLRLGQDRIEKSATGVRVHLDQLRPARPEVEVVSHEGSVRTEVGPRDRRSP
jgi:hypothetical protein